MKEIDENSSESDRNSLRDKKVTNNSVDKFRYIIQNKNDFLIRINKYNFEQINININNYSFLKINQMMKSFPEENVVFICDKKVLYTPRSSYTSSRPSKQSKSSSGSASGSSSKNVSSSSSFNSSRNNNITKNKNLKEEIINTDIPKQKKEFNSNLNNNLNIGTLNNKKTNTNIDKMDDDELIQHMRNIDKLKLNSEETKIIKKQNITSIHNSYKKFIIFKWIFHFYLIVGIILFLHYLTFIYSKYNESVYKWLCIILVILLLYVGFFGIKNQNLDEKYLFFFGLNLFRTNFIVFIITIINLIALLLAGGQFLFIKSQGIMGYLIVFIYLLTIFVQAIYVIYYDIIIEVVSLENSDNNKIIEGVNKNYLTIQLIDVN
jgi:hypothetical protein